MDLTFDVCIQSMSSVKKIKSNYTYRLWQVLNLEGHTLYVIA